MSNSFKKVEKVDPFNDVSLGDWKPDKKNSNKSFLAFQRTAEVNVPERYAIEWHDPVTFAKKLIWGKTVLTERKLISKDNAAESLQREIYPAIQDGQMKDVI